MHGRCIAQKRQTFLAVSARPAFAPVKASPHGCTQRCALEPRVFCDRVVHFAGWPGRASSEQISQWNQFAGAAPALGAAIRMRNYLIRLPIPLSRRSTRDRSRQINPSYSRSLGAADQSPGVLKRGLTAWDRLYTLGAPYWYGP